MTATVKEMLAAWGVEEAREFCHLNKMAPPEFNIVFDKNDPISIRISRVGTCGYYRTGAMYVSVPLCAHQNPMYSWPAYISDRTPYGVIEHELGHYVDEIKTGKQNIYQQRGDNFSDMIRGQSGEKAITSYAPNNMEWFAEIFRLFVTNPNLLLVIRPKAYDALIRAGLIPCVTENYIEVLEKFKAPQKIFERLEKFKAK